MSSGAWSSGYVLFIFLDKEFGMDLLDNAINRRLMSGSFPSEKLYPVPIEDSCEIDFANEAADGWSLFKEHPEVFCFVFLSCRDRIKELDKMQMPELYTKEVNCYINTKYDPDSLNVTGVIQDAYNLCPVVTSLDKILWMGAHSYHFEGEFVNAERVYDPRKMMFAWIYMLQVVQEKEQKTGKTIDVEAVTFDCDLVGMILNDWEKNTVKELIPLTKKQTQEFSVLSNRKARLSEKVLEEKKQSRFIAEKTDDEWQLFIKIINDLSEKESDVIAGILDDVSISEKRRIISEYRSVLRNVEKGRYNLDGLELNLLDIFGSVNERLTKASRYANAMVRNGEPFRVHPAAFVLAMQPDTYNYLLMTFHEFRLSPGKETARQFVSLALSCLKKNLGFEEKQLISIDEMIEEFASVVFDFVNKNREAINNLSFNKVQNDSITVDGSSKVTQETDIFTDEMNRILNDFQNNEEYDKEIEAIMEGHGRILSEDELLCQIKKQEDMNALTENKVLAQQLIFSLNIIYLFCDALRIMLNNKHAHVKIKKREKAEQYRGRLLDLDEELVFRAYSGINEDEINMREYREQTGVISTYLSEREYQEELFRSTVCFEILQEAITGLVLHIEEQSTDSIIEAKAKIKEHINRFPDVVNKEIYTEWLDSISTRICNALINTCRNKEEEYNDIKSNILKKIGEKSDELPLSTIDSLTTAEMLYGKYATDECAEKGFDYSCISALYYQAFEDAYNALIWRGYSDLLNSLCVGERTFVDLLTEKSKKSCKQKTIVEPDFVGYLSKYPATRKNYTHYDKKKKEVTVSKYCMYGPFSRIMENITNPDKPEVSKDKLNHFCHYFAKITGFPDESAMREDKAFIEKCRDFMQVVETSADNRNNASHGGSFISMDQCSADKKTVLNDLETVRSSSIGLIQQLLYLLYKE